MAGIFSDTFDNDAKGLTDTSGVLDTVKKSILTTFALEIAKVTANVCCQ